MPYPRAKPPAGASKPTIPASLNRRWQRQSTRSPLANAGFTRSSSMATGSKSNSGTPPSRFSPGAATTGPTVSEKSRPTRGTSMPDRRSSMARWWSRQIDHRRGCSGRVAGLACRVGVDVAALQQIVEASDPVPTIGIRFQHQRVLAALVGLAVVFRQQVDQQLAGVAGKPDRERNLPRLLVEMVHEQYRIVAPVIAHHQHRRVARRDHLEVAPADLRDFLAHPDDALGPVQHRVGITALLGDVDVLVSVGALVDDGRAGLIAFGKAGMRLGRPLHRRAGAIALG